MSATEIRDQAISLAQAGTDVPQAVVTMQARGDHRVALVMAKRIIEGELEDKPDPSAARALEIIEEVLGKGDWAE